MVTEGSARRERTATAGSSTRRRSYELALDDRFGVFRHQRPRELELRVHDREAVLLEHDRGAPSIAERLAFADGLREPSVQRVATRSRRSPQIHILKCGPEPAASATPRGMDLRTVADHHPGTVRHKRRPRTGAE
jgi:hypothetical protein